ncbi:MAG: hypothetical protein JST21_16640 [Bacteroidetes bacterium]|nr:hypothetical protein [Bacteroidota bacterium]
MKKISFIIALGIIAALFLPHKAVAQENPFIVLEYMHVKPGNANEYLQIENFWRQIHIARQKKGDIIGWSVWQVEAPYKMDDPYQYVVLTVYPHFSNILHPFEGIDISKVFPNASKDSLNKMFALTEKARDLIQQDIFAADDHVGNTNGDSINYLMATYVKVIPEKEQAFHAFEKDHWKPVVTKVIKGGFANFWWYGSLMFNDGINAPYNHIMVVNWARDNMFDNEPPFDQYRKEDPAAFEGYNFFTRTHRILLHKVASLKSPAK